MIGNGRHISETLNIALMDLTIWSKYQKEHWEVLDIDQHISDSTGTLILMTLGVSVGPWLDLVPSRACRTLEGLGRL